MTRIAVIGSREFKDSQYLENFLDEALFGIEEIEIVSGTARGADKLGEKYAEKRGFRIKRFPADWETYGRKAGFIRNKEIIDYSDLVVAFWDGKSPGTKMALDLAKKRGLETIVTYI